MTIRFPRLFRPSGQAGFLAGRFSPTADLYLGFSCQDLLADGRIRRLAPTVFQAGDTLVVMRHTAGLKIWPPCRRLIYLIDDDIRAGIADSALPLVYRAKLVALELSAARRLEPEAAVILTTSPALSARYRRLHPGKPVEEIAPAWPVEAMPEIAPDPDSAPGSGIALAPKAAAPGCRIALLMGKSHAQDAAPLWHPLAGLLSRRPDITLTVSGNLALPRGMRDHPQIERLPALDWAAYRLWLGQARFGIGLVPHLASCRFNAARSDSKLGEYAMTGAAVLASDSWGAGREAAAAGRCLALAPRPEDWIAAIEHLVCEPARARTLAARNRAALAAADTARRQRALWERLL